MVMRKKTATNFIGIPNTCFIKKNTKAFGFMSGSCHLDRASNVEIGVECQIFVVFFLTATEFYNLGHILGKGA